MRLVSYIFFVFQNTCGKLQCKKEVSVHERTFMDPTDYASPIKL